MIPSTHSSIYHHFYTIRHTGLSAQNCNSTLKDDKIISLLRLSHAGVDRYPIDQCMLLPTTVFWKLFLFTAHDWYGRESIGLFPLKFLCHETFQR